MAKTQAKQPGSQQRWGRAWPLVMATFTALLFGALHARSNPFLELINAFIEGRSNGQDRRFENFAFESFQILLGGRFIHLVGHNDPGLFQKRFIVKTQFVEDLLIVVPGLARICPRHIY